jgi:hypothetical protein
MRNKPAEKTETSVRILKTATCSSLSGKSKLTYQIGYDDKAGIQFRITENSAAGAFNQDWFPLKSIEAALDKAPKGEPVTAVNFMSLFRNMSTNTPFFIFAAMRHEGLFVPSKKNKRSYDRVDTADFLAAMQALIEGRVPSQNDAKVKKNAGRKSVTAKAPSGSKKK